MSTLYVDNLAPNLGSQVQIPNLKPLAGSVVQVVTDQKTVGNSGHNADIRDLSISVTGGFSSSITIQSLQITPKFANSKILLVWSGQLRTNMSSGAGGVQVFFGKDGSNLLTSGGNYDSMIFRYSNNQLTDQYSTETCRWSFTAGQTTPMTLDVRFSCYNTAATIFLSHDGVETLTAMEIAQ